MARHHIFLLTLCYHLKLFWPRFGLARIVRKPPKSAWINQVFSPPSVSIFCLLSQWAVQSWLCLGHSVALAGWSCSSEGILVVPKGQRAGSRSCRRLGESQVAPGAFGACWIFLPRKCCNIAPWPLRVVRLALPVLPVKEEEGQVQKVLLTSRIAE